MENIKRRENETDFEYAKRIVYGKLVDKTIDLDYSELSELIYDKGYSSDVARRIFYGLRDAFQLMDKENIGVISKDETLAKIDEKLLELKKERMKLQSTKIEYNRNLRKDSRFELFYENIRNAKERLPMPKFEYISPCNEDNGGYILSLADIHYGAFFTSENNYYSRSKVKKQFETLLFKLKTLIHKNKIKKIKVIELGDTIQGMLRLSDVRLNDIPVVDSVVEVSRLIATFLNELSKYVHIEYRHIMASNHSQNRYLGTKAGEMPLEDMERVIGNYIKDLTSNNPRIDVVLSDKDYDSFEVCGQSILSLHGHQVKNVNNIIKDYSMLHRKFYDLCFVAHFHGGKQISVGEGNGNTEIVICPSFIGSDPYSDKLKLGSKAMCKLFKIEEGMGITENYSIILN